MKTRSTKPLTEDEKNIGFRCLCLLASQGEARKEQGRLLLAALTEWLKKEEQC